MSWSYAEYFRSSMRKYGFCMYVRRLTNQINAVIHGRVSYSIDWVHLAQLCRRRPARGARRGAESELQVQGVIQTKFKCSTSSTLRFPALPGITVPRPVMPAFKYSL